MRRYKHVNVPLILVWVVILIVLVLIAFSPRQRDNGLFDKKKETTTTYYDTITHSLSDPNLDQTEKYNNIDLTPVMNIYWYLYSKDTNDCYVFMLEDEHNAFLAYYDPEGLEKDRCIEGHTVYSQKGNKLSMTHLPNAFPIKTFVLTVENNRVYYDGKELVGKSQLTIK